MKNNLQTVMEKCPKCEGDFLHLESSREDHVSQVWCGDCSHRVSDNVPEEDIRIIWNYLARQEALAELEASQNDVGEALEFNPQELRHGLYEIFWKCGGSSLASVGSTHSGARWYAPTNWVSEKEKYPDVAATDWSEVERVQLLLTPPTPKQEGE